MNVRDALEKIIYRTSTVSILDDLAPIIEMALQIAVKEMAVEYGVYYVDEDELKSRIDECVTVGIKTMISNS